MSSENEGFVATWEEIKVASRKLDWIRDQTEAQKRVARAYLAHTECEERLAILGYN